MFVFNSAIEAFGSLKILIKEKWMWLHFYVLENSWQEPSNLLKKESRVTNNI